MWSPSMPLSVAVKKPDLGRRPVNNRFLRVVEVSKGIKIG